MSIGLYAAMSPLCPMLLAEHAFARTPTVDPTENHVTHHAHDDAAMSSEQGMHHDDCAGHTPCTIGEQVDSVVASSVPEIPVTCFNVSHDAPEIERSHGRATLFPFVNRPPPRLSVATIVLQR
jgi:hypothetical protein